MRKKFVILCIMQSVTNVCIEKAAMTLTIVLLSVNFVGMFAL